MPIDEFYDFTKRFIGHGYYSRISMSQKRKEIVELANTVKLIKPRNIIEIGTRKGGSLFIWSRICDQKG